MNLTAAERETLITFYDDLDICSIYTCSRPVMTKLDKLCKSNPDTYKLVSKNSYSKTYETQKNLISFRTPKHISEEHREKLKENAKRMHK